MIFVFRCSFWRMNFLLKDAANNPVLSIIGPGCICDGPYAACCENKFTVTILRYIERQRMSIYFDLALWYGWNNRNRCYS